MDTVKFIEERKRMCKSFDTGCNGCPAFNACNNNLCCAVGNESMMDATDQIAIVEEWFAAHPRKTRSSEFLKHYPNATVGSRGIVDICPQAIDKDYIPANGCCNTSCDECSYEYWTQEVEV